MRVMINKQKTKVLFALLDNNLADIFLSFLTFPLGVIIRLLKKHYGDDEAPNVGSLNTLYKGLENLDSSHFRTEVSKLMLINPRSNPLEVSCSKLKINIDDTKPIEYFTCDDLGCSLGSVIINNDTETCSCGKSMNTKWVDEHEGGEVFTVKTSTFLISDDLRMVPNMIGPILQNIQGLGITDTDGAEQMTFTIGFNQIMDLLKWSLLSKTPLTDLILQQRQMHDHSPIPIPKYEPFTLVPLLQKKVTSIISEKIVVKAMIQKSTQKLLFVEAEEDFIDFLFGFLVIPLGQVKSLLLMSNTSLGRIDNLCESLAILDAEKYLKIKDMKEKVIVPNLPPYYLSKNQIFDPIEREYYIKNRVCRSFVYPYDEGRHVKGPGMFMVTDDLTVTPLCMLSTISTLNELKIPLSDVEELDIDVGFLEGLSILKASLTSTSALTNGLNPIFKKQLKRKREAHDPHI